MQKPDPTAPFFVGYLTKLPAGLGRFLSVVIVSIIGGFAGVALALSVTQDDPGDGRFRGDLKYQTLTGKIEQTPYPVLRLPPDDKFPQGRSILLSGGGKSGVHKRAAKFPDQVVDAGGIIIRRGDLDMLQVGGKVKIRATKTGRADFEPAAPVDLGKWRLTGEICDGKCYSGAMRPGRGLAHKACANVCLIGGVPPVFVSTSEVDGRIFFLLADKDGAPLSDDYFQYVAQLVRVDGAVERRGDLHVFKMDLDTLERLQ